MAQDAATCKFETGKRFKDWRIKTKIDEGGFGQVYTVENVVTKQMAALKAESNEVEGGSAIKLEIQVLRALNEGGELAHIPVVHHAAKHSKYCYMVMTLLGENLKNLKLNNTKEKELLTPQTWLRLGVQCLYSLKLVHDHGFIHRDIKPNNFVMGHPSDPDRARLVHILDFGLARSYAYKSGDHWVPRLARGSAEFRGTLRYCSPNVHDRLEQGRRDDIWSLFYVLIELHCGLPWQTTRDKSKIEFMKVHMPDEDLNINFPKELHGVIPALRKLDMYMRPDYQNIYECFLAAFKSHNVTYDMPYDWETKEQLEKMPKPKKTAVWEDAAEFFKSDPINIHKAPSKEEKTMAGKANRNLTVEASTKNSVKDSKKTITTTNNSNKKNNS